MTNIYMTLYGMELSSKYHYIKKNFKIPKEKSESVNRRTRNTMVKRQKDIKKTMIYKTLHKTKEQTVDESRSLRMESDSFL